MLRWCWCARNALCPGNFYRGKRDHQILLIIPRILLAILGKCAAVSILLHGLCSWGAKAQKSVDSFDFNVQQSLIPFEVLSV